MDAIRLPVRLFERATGAILRVPEIVVIEPTNRCNLSCVMCYRLDHLGETGDMGLELFTAIAQSVRGARHICCHGGGEPLLHPRIFEMIDIAYDTCRPETLSITTSATTLTPQAAARLRDSKLTRLYVSIDGADPETYARIRGFPLERVAENVRYFKSISGIPTVIQYTVMRQNLSSLLGLPRLVSRMGAESINVQHLLNWNLQVEGARIVDVYAEFEEVRARVLAQATEYGIECSIPPIPGGYPPRYMDRCDLPFRQLYFNWRGEIAPCCVAVHVTLEKSFEDRNGSNIRNWRRRVARGDFFEECRRFCYVRGAS